MTEKQIRELLDGEVLCDFCELDEDDRGVKGGPNGPIYCCDGGYYCENAAENALGDYEDGTMGCSVINGVCSPSCPTLKKGNCYLMDDVIANARAGTLKGFSPADIANIVILKAEIAAEKLGD